MTQYQFERLDEQISQLGLHVLNLATEVAEARSDLKHYSQAVADQEKRVRRLEAWRWALPPSVVSGLGGLILSVLYLLKGVGH